MLEHTFEFTENHLVSKTILIM